MRWLILKHPFAFKLMVAACTIVLLFIYYDAQASDRPGPDPYDATVTDYINGHSNTERARRTADDLRDLDIPSKSETTKACFRMKQRDGFVNETCALLLDERNRTLSIWRAIPECKDECID